MDIIKGITTLRFDDSVNVRGLLEAIQPADGGNCAGRRLLIDVTSTTLALTYDDVQKLAALVQMTPVENRRGVRAAFVVAEQLDFGVARMIGSHLQDLGVEVRVYKNSTEAMSYLSA